MSLESIEQLLLAHHINPNKVLGQNFMVEPAFYPKLCSLAHLSDSDVVLDAGAGFGLLTRYLVGKCFGVVAVEKDRQLVKVLCREFSSALNVVVVEGDVLTVSLPLFNKVIAIPPYYLSSDLVLWLLDRRVDYAVLIVQKEFAQRLVAEVGSDAYGWLTVVVGQLAKAELFDEVPKELFYPQPEVDSIILRIQPWKHKPFEVKDPAQFIQLVKWLFTQRNKKLAKALTPYLKSHFKLGKKDAEKVTLQWPFYDKRPRELTPNNFGVIADALSNY